MTAKRMGALIVALVTAVSMSISPAYAGMVTTGEALSGQAVDQERQHLLEMLDRDAVRAQLQEHGVDPAQARARVASLSDAEVQRLNQSIDEAPAGGSIVGAVVFIFIVLLITDIAGVTDVFPFVKKNR